MRREYEVRGRKLQLHLGDITRLEVDAIVSSENSDLVMDRVDGPSVSGAIRRIEGEEMAQSLARLGPVEPGRAVVLPARRLPCRWVIHAATVVRTEEGHVSSPELVRESVRSALRLAAGLGLSSVAFPAFGVRAASLPPAAAAEAMVREMVAALSEPTPLQRIVVALLDPESFLTFYEEALRRAARADEPLPLRATWDGQEVSWSFAGEHPVETTCAAPLAPAAREELLGRVRRLRRAEERRLLDPAAELRALGARVQGLLPAPVRERLRAEAPAAISLRLDEPLGAIPFELAWDGEAFLLERAAVARHLRTQDQRGLVAPAPDTRSLARLNEGPLEVLVVCGERAHPGSQREGAALVDLLWRRAGERVRLALLGGPRATAPRVLDALGRAELIHWCGHTAEDAGWALAHGQRLGPAELSALTTPARLVVANSCGAEGAGALARAFLLAGARNYVGTWWDVEDELAEGFALRLHEALLLGRTLGEALQTARGWMRAHDPLHWAAWLHWGDPRLRVFQPVAGEGRNRE